MPIMFLLGSPRSGKSYEAVSQHILPALKAGRKIVTNIPLNVEAFARLDASYVDLIDIKKPVYGWPDPFGDLSDYNDDWVHPVEGYGPLYVIDECHTVLHKKVDPEIVHWFATHGHARADVLLITQTLTGVHPGIRDRAELFKRVKRRSIVGRPKEYWYGEYDSARSRHPIFKTTRRYDPAMFPLYTSFTLARSDGKEANIVKGRVFWLRWQMIFLYVLVGGYLVFAISGSKGSVDSKKHKAVPVAPVDAPRLGDRTGGIEAPRVDVKDYSLVYFDQSGFILFNGSDRKKIKGGSEIIVGFYGCKLSYRDGDAVKTAVRKGCDHD